MEMKELLWQCLGVLIQTVPVAVLLGCLFDEEETRGSKRNYYTGAVTLLVVVSVIFAVSWMRGTYNISRFAFGNILMTFIIILSCIYYFYMIKANLYKKIIVLGIGFTYAAIVFLLNAIYVAWMFDISDWTLSYMPENLMGLVGITMATWPPMLWFVKRILRPGIQEISLEMLKKQCVFVILGLLLFCIESTSLDFNNVEMDTVLAFSVIGNVAVMYYFFFNEINRMREQADFEQKLNNLKIQSRSIGKNMEEMKRMQHNIRHHLNVISVL